jgi:hypothetical protein
MRPARAATNLAPTATYTIMCIYQQNGYKDREDYLDSLREDYGEMQLMF